MERVDDMNLRRHYLEDRRKQLTALGAVALLFALLAAPNARGIRDNLAVLAEAFQVNTGIGRGISGGIGKASSPPRSILSRVSARNLNRPTDSFGVKAAANNPTEYLVIPQFRGYIVKLHGKPSLEKKRELEENVKALEKELEVSQINRRQDTAILEQKINAAKQKIPSEVNSYRNQLKNNLTECKQRLGRKISELPHKAKREWVDVFNGIFIDADGNDIKKIADDSCVKKIYPNTEIKISLQEAAPHIKASDLWQLPDPNGNPITGQGITIAIIDTGIDYAHPMFGACTQSQFLNRQCPKVIGGWDFVNNDADPMDDNFHGTHVAGIAAGNSSVLKGAAPDATLVAYKVLNNYGSGYESDIISAIERAADPNEDGDFSDHVSVASASLGGSGTPDDPLPAAFDNAVDAGVVVAVAAGNWGSAYKTIACPGCARKVITVGASDKNDQIAEFSSVGPVTVGNDILIKPEVVAPGVDICSAIIPNSPYFSECITGQYNYSKLSGTSMATPLVAGVAALLLQAHPRWTPEDIKSAIVNGAVDLAGMLDAYRQGGGRVNAFNAHQIPLSVAPSVINLGIHKINKARGPILACNFNSSTICGEGEAPSEAGSISFESGTEEQSVLFSTTTILKYPSLDNFTSAQGTIDFWVKLNFDPNNPAPGVTNPNDFFHYDRWFFDSTSIPGGFLNNPIMRFTAIDKVLRLEVPKGGANWCWAYTTDLRNWAYGPQGEWHRITVAWDSSNPTVPLRLFIDNNLPVSWNANCTGGNSWEPGVTDSITIGAPSSGSPPSADSWIDEFKVYDYVNLPELSAPITLSNKDSVPWGVKLAEKRVLNIDTGETPSGIMRFSSNNICIQPGARVSVLASARIGNISEGTYSAINAGELYEQCDFSPASYRTKLQIPTAFARLYSFDLTFVNTPPFFKGWNSWRTLAGNNKLLDWGNQWESSFDTSHRYELLTRYPSFDLVGASTQWDNPYPAIDTRMYFKRVESQPSIVMDYQTIQPFQSNLEEVVSGRNLETYSSMHRIDLPAVPWGTWLYGVSYYAPGLPLRWSLGTASDNNLINTIYETSVELLGQDQGVLHRDATNFIALSATIPYPFTTSDSINPGQIKSTNLGIGDRLIPDYNDAQYFGIGIYSLLDPAFAWWSSNFAVPKTGTFSFRDGCPRCNYVVSNLLWSFVRPAFYAIHNFNGVNQDLSFFEEPLYLDLGTNYCFRGSLYCGHSILRGSVHDKGDVGNTRGVAISESLAGNLTITTPDGYTGNFPSPPSITNVWDGANWTLDCVYRNISFPLSLQDPKFCQVGDYSISWRLPDFHKNRTLTLDAVANFDGTNWTIKELNTCKDDDGDGITECDFTPDCDDSDPKLTVLCPEGGGGGGLRGSKKTPQLKPAE